MKIPTFVDVLDKARAWRSSNTPDALEQAFAVLEAGIAEHDDALPLGDEMVLVLKQQGKLDEAVDLLKRLERRFKYIGEETLCRWGAVYKLRAWRNLANRAAGAAEHDYRASERYYARAYEEYGGFYPRINELTMRFALAGLANQAGRQTESAVLLRDVEAKALAMLTDAGAWAERKSDDAIWIAASQGEVCVLLRRWSEAEASYAEAMRLAEGKQFYSECMRRQLQEELMPAFERLSLSIAGRLADADEFFGAAIRGDHVIKAPL